MAVSQIWWVGIGAEFLLAKRFFKGFVRLILVSKVVVITMRRLSGKRRWKMRLSEELDDLELLSKIEDKGGATNVWTITCPLRYSTR